MGIDIGATIKSGMNFMTPGVGAIHQDNGKPPIGAVPGIGTTKSGARFEQGLASKLSGMFGTNVGSISADSYRAKAAAPNVPSAQVTEEEKTAIVGNTAQPTQSAFTRM